MGSGRIPFLILSKVAQIWCFTKLLFRYQLNLPSCSPRIVTGCYDRVMRIWSFEGKLVHQVECSMEPISSLCFVARTETIWVAAGTSYAYVIDVKTGDNVHIAMFIICVSVRCLRKNFDHLSIFS